MKSRQQGVSLPLVLALLLAMALLGAAVLQSGVLHTRMAADLHARNLAFQTAESVLRAGEDLASGGPIPSAPGCLGGLCNLPELSTLERWKQPGFGGWQSVAGVPAIGLPSAEFMVEYMGPAPSSPGCEQASPIPINCLRPLYRITARSAGERGTVMLQSHYLDGRVSWREMGGE